MKYFILSLAFMLFSVLATAQDYAIQQLEDSPRHHEWVKIESNGRILHNFVAYPEVSEKATVVIVIHENRGLNDWARSFADQLASKGFIAIAPDLISNTVEGFEKTTDFATSDDARSAIYELDPSFVTTDLLNVHEYAQNLSAGNGKVAVIGFCWGGSQSFRFATNAGDNIEAAFVFYGTGPQEKEPYQNIEVPIYGFYGGNDNRVNASIPFSETTLKELKKVYNYEIYEGAGHAFMRQGDNPETAPEDPNVIARNKSWSRIVTLLESL